MPRFDTHIVVDWSARSAPSPQRPCRDAIWWAAADTAGGGAREPVYVRTRHEAVRRLAGIVAGELRQGRRVLLGFDFAFGYPAGVAGHVTGTPSALALRDWLAARVRDGPDNRNNRFDVAAAINRKFPGRGPFWGLPAGPGRERLVRDIPPGATERTGAGGSPNTHRIADRRARGAKTVWQLAYAGCVGSQTLVGLPALKRLVEDRRVRDRVGVWPFDTGLAAPDAPAAIAEVYPSLLRKDIAERTVAGEIPDRAQVRVNAEAFARLDAAGGLDALFAGPDGLSGEERRLIETEEGWILGLGHEESLRGALIAG